MFNNYSIIWIIRIFLQIRIRIRIFLPESRIFGFGFENFLTMNKIRIRIRKFSGLRIRFEIRIRSKKRFVSTLLWIWQNRGFWHNNECLERRNDGLILNFPKASNRSPSVTSTRHPALGQPDKKWRKQMMKLNCRLWIVWLLLHTATALQHCPFTIDS